MLSLLLTAFVCAQDPRLDVVEGHVPGARLQAVSVAVRGPVDEALCRYREATAARVLPEGASHGLEVLHGGLAVFRAEFPVEGAPATATAWVAALLGDGAGFDADRAELAIGRAALAADDRRVQQPGSVLHTLLLQQLLPGAPAGAQGWLPDPVAVAALDPRALAARRLPAERMALAWVGGAPLPAELQHQALLARLRLPAAVAVESLGEVPAAAEPVRAVHPQVRGVFACVAVRMPGRASPDLALGIEVLRTRAQQQFQRYRGGEDRALAPFVAWSWGAADPVLRLHRRGPSLADEGFGRAQLPARGADDEQLPLRELDELLASLRQRPPTARELQGAVRMLQFEYALPPWNPSLQQSLVEVPEALRIRARAMALATVQGITGADLEGLASATPESVAAALLPLLDPARCWRCVLVPVARPAAAQAR